MSKGWDWMSPLPLFTEAITRHYLLQLIEEEYQMQRFITDQKTRAITQLS